MNQNKQKGFTLIELLIVIAIIAILASVVFVALDPLSRFRDARDAARANDISEVMSAVKLDQVDNGGSYISDIDPDMVAGEVYMIGTATSSCSSENANCDTNVDGSTNGGCVDLGGLVTEGYLGKVPISPDGDGSWDATKTGYTLQRDSTGILHIRACESENTTEISVSR